MAQQTQPASPTQMMMNSSTHVPQHVTQHVIHKRQDEGALELTVSTTAPTAIDSMASSGNTFVPPGVSTLSSLNSLALTLALRLAPVTVAHAAPSAFQVASLQTSEINHPLSQVSNSPSTLGQRHITLEPMQHFPLSMPLQIPLEQLRGKKGFTPSSYGQLIELKEEEGVETEGKWWHSTASGVIGGVFCVYAGQPFDTVKVRIQTQSKMNPLYSNPLDCLKKTITQGGYRALYKGSSAALASVVTENAVLFTAQSAIRNTIKSLSADPTAELSLGQEALAGGIAGFFSSTAITPAEVIKCRLQIQDRRSSSGFANTPVRYSGPVDAVVKIARTEGLKGLFAGLPSVWMRDIPFNFVFLGSYEAFCSAASWKLNKTRSELGAAELFVCGGLAGVSGWSIVFPMDVVKSKMQTSATSGSAFQVIRHTLKAEGVRAFYQGWSAAVLRAFPANAALLMGVELSRRFFEKFD